MANNPKFALATPVHFVNGRTGGEVAALIVKVLTSEDAAAVVNLVFFDADSGMAQHRSAVPYSKTVFAETFHLPTDDTDPKDDLEARQRALDSNINLAARNAAPVNVGLPNAVEPEAK